MVVAPINHIEIRDGEAVIAGTRITVEDIAVMYVWNESPVDWIVENYSVTPAQVYAAVSYYYDHKEAIDRSVREGEELARKIGISSDELIARMRARQQPKNTGE
jgi:uncharacterized protein (DUF433 family)